MHSFIGLNSAVDRRVVCLQSFPREFAKTFSARFRTGGADVGILPVYLALWAGTAISHVHGSVSHAACLVLNMSRLCQHRDLHRHGGRRLQGQGWCPTDHISCYISPGGCAGKPRRCDCRTAGLAGAAQRCVGLVRPPAVRPRHAARIRGSGGIPSQPRQASSRETCRGGSCVGWNSRAV